MLASQGISQRGAKERVVRVSGQRLAVQLLLAPGVVQEPAVEVDEVPLRRDADEAVVLLEELRLPAQGLQELLEADVGLDVLGIADERLPERGLRRLGVAGAPQALGPGRDLRDGFADRPGTRGRASARDAREEAGRREPCPEPDSCGREEAARRFHDGCQV